MRISSIASILSALALSVGSAATARAETAPSPALAQVAISDGAALTAHWNASIYGRLWADPVLAPLHPLLQQGVDAIGQATGLDPFTALSAAKGISLRWLGLDTGAEHLPQVVIIADFGGQAAQMMELARKAEWTATTVAGADEALAHDGTHALLARYGHQLRLAFNQTELPTWTADTGASDMASRLDVPKLATAIGGILTNEQADSFPGVLVAWLRAHVGVITSEMRITADGMRDTYVVPAPTSGFIPVDRALLARIPANAVSVSAIGFDGAAWWKEYGELVLGAVAAADKPSQPADTRAAQAKIDEALKSLNLPSLPELLSGFKGTDLFFMTPGVPMMGSSLVLPRSPVIDLCVRELLTRVGEQPPEEGAAIMLPVPNMPFTPQLVLDHDCWLLTTDSVLATQWVGVDGGWAASPVGKVVLAHADGKAVMISGTDNAAMIQTIAGYAGIGLGQAPGLTPEQKRAIQQGLTRFAALAKPGYGVVKTTATGFEAEMESVFSASLVMAVIPAIAIPNLLESRVTSNESATAAALKSGVLPAEVQFQAGGYADGDENGIGEYGFFPEMSGAVPAGGGITLNLLAPWFGEDQPAMSGYRFVVYLPDGKGGAVSSLPIPRPKDGAAEREKYWVAYAWPSDASQGRRAFAIDQSGNVYATKPAAKTPEPKWNDLYGGKGWGSKPIWLPYQRNGRRPGAQGQPAPKANPEF